MARRKGRGGMDESTVQDHRLLSRRVWEEFCAKLAEAGDVLFRPDAPAGEADQAEGLHCLTQILRHGLISNVEASNPDFPVFFRMNDEVTQFVATNPDNVYLSAVVKGDRDYRISGQLGNVFYFSIGSKENRMHLDSTIASTGELTDREIKCAVDGTFEIVASSIPKPGNWLPMSADSNLILIRQTMKDRLHERPGVFRISRIDGPIARPALRRRDIENALNRTAQFVRGSIDKFSDVLIQYTDQLNEIPDIGQEFWRATGADPLLSYLNGCFKIGCDEAWVINFKPTEPNYWNFAIYNYWGQLFHYPESPVAINSHSAKRNADGSVTVIVAAHDPGIGNWLDTAGHTEGQVMFRGMDMRAVPKMHCQVVKIAELVG
jgi:hypothetical protein